MLTDKNSQKQPFWYGISNPHWLSIKAHYFLVYAGIGSYFPFLVLFYVSLGLTTAQIGMIEFMNILISTIAWPIVGSIADKTGRHSLVLALFTVAFLIPLTSLALFSPPLPDKYPAILKLTSYPTFNYEFEVCNPVLLNRLTNMSSIFIDSKSNDTTNQLVCKDDFRMCANFCACLTFAMLSFYFIAGKNDSVELSEKLERSNNNCSVFVLLLDRKLFSTSKENASFNCEVEFAAQKLDNNVAFALICLLRSLSAFSMEPSLSVIDAIAYDMLGPKNRHLWSQQRMFAAIGWGIGASIMGIVLDHLHTFKICFFTMAILVSTTVFIALFWLPKHLHPKEKEKEKLPFCQALGRAFLSPIFCICCLIALASGMLLSVSQIVWPQHMEELGAPKKFFGLVAIVVSAVEIPSFFFAGAVADKIGEMVCSIIMFLAYTIRFGCNALLTPATFWLALPVESLHLFCFAFFFSAITKVAHCVVPPGTSSTVQSVVAASFGGIGFGSGILLGSFIYEVFGRYYSFLIYAAFAFCNFLLTLILYVAYLRNAIARIVKFSEEKAKTQELSSAKQTESLIDPGHAEEL